MRTSYMLHYIFHHRGRHGEMHFGKIVDLRPEKLSNPHRSFPPRCPSHLTSMTSSLNDKSFYLPLDDRYYNLDEEEKIFFKKETGIQDDAELKKHIIAVQTKAFSVGASSVHLYETSRIFSRYIRFLLFASSTLLGL